MSNIYVLTYGWSEESEEDVGEDVCLGRHRLTENITSGGFFPYAMVDVLIEEYANENYEGRKYAARIYDMSNQHRNLPISFLEVLLLFLSRLIK